MVTPTAFNGGLKASTDAEKRANKKRYACRNRAYRWVLLLVGISITILTVIYSIEVYAWIYKSSATVVKTFHDGEERVKDGQQTSNQDRALKLALLITMNAPCACLVGFLSSTAYYWKEKRDRKASRSIERAKQRLRDSATATADADPKLINVRYEDLPEHQKVDVVVGSLGIDPPPPAKVKEGWRGSVTSWLNGAAVVHKGGYTGRDTRRRNWEEDRGIEMVNRSVRPHEGGADDGDGARKSRSRPITEWPLGVNI